MKKKIIVFILFELIFSLFAKEQIGICNKNVYNIGIIQNNIPVCFYYEDNQVLISVVKKYYVRIGNTDFGPYDSIDSWLFTSDKIIYTARIDNEACLFMNGACLERYKSISNFFIADDKETLSYAFEADSGVYLKCKDKEIGPFEQLKYFLVSNDKIISYVVKEKFKFYIYTEQNKYGPFDDVTDCKYQQEESYAYIVEKNKKEYVYTKDGLLAGPFDNLYIRNYSSDGKKLAYEAHDYNKNNINETLWVNKDKISEGVLISDVDFVNDKLLYSVCTREESYICFGNKKYGPFAQVGAVASSPDKSTIAFSYSHDYSPDAKFYLSVGNEKAGPYEYCYQITFSPNGKKIAYVIKKSGQYYLVCNQNQYGPYESINDIAFSEDGNSYAYITSTEYFKDYILHIGDFQTEIYDFIIDLKFYNNNLTYTAVKNGLYYNMIVLDDKEFVGKYVNGNFIYIKDGKIIKE